LPEWHDILRESWQQAVLVRGSAEDQARELLARMSLAPEMAQEGLEQVTAALRDYRKQLSAQVESAVRRTLRMPTRKDLDSLTQRVVTLEARVSRALGEA
jgi:hypothetical protein